MFPQLIKILLVTCLLDYAWGLYEGCDQSIILRVGETRTFGNPIYSGGRYRPGSSCRFYARAPSGYQIIGECSITIDRNEATKQCTSEYFYMARDGDMNLGGAEYFCGPGTFTRYGVFNEMVFAHVSRSSYTAGRYTCKLRSVPQPCDCGWTVNSKIVNGNEAGINEYTSMVGIVDRGINQIVCGGAIIHYRYVMTTAHCILALRGASYTAVLVGDHDISTGVETKYSRLYGVSSLIRHEQYSSATKLNDIGLILTSEEIIWKRGVGPVCLPFRFSATAFVNTYAEVAGWGSTSYGGPTVSRLRKTLLKLIPNQECSSRLQRSVALSQVCTLNPPRDTCQYDSGGSLFVRSGRLFSVGLVSYGQGCGTSLPSVNTNVVTYLGWIQTKTGVSFCRK